MPSNSDARTCTHSHVDTRTHMHACTHASSSYLIAVNMYNFFTTTTVYRVLLLSSASILQIEKLLETMEGELSRGPFARHIGSPSASVYLKSKLNDLYLFVYIHTGNFGVSCRVHTRTKSVNSAWQFLDEVFLEKKRGSVIRTLINTRLDTQTQNQSRDRHSTSATNTAWFVVVIINIRTIASSIVSLGQRHRKRYLECVNIVFSWSPRARHHRESQDHTVSRTTEKDVGYV